LKRLFLSRCLSALLAHGQFAHWMPGSGLAADALEEVVVGPGDVGAGVRAPVRQGLDTLQRDLEADIPELVADRGRLFLTSWPCTARSGPAARSGWPPSGTSDVGKRSHLECKHCFPPVKCRRSGDRRATM